YDAASLQLFTGGAGGLQGRTRLLDTKGEIRDLKWLHTAKYGDILVAARNNKSLLFFQYKN
ncbi:MAG TPA: hypothetical protein VE035_13605, partial [Puia sp.]|nr:hypothetical protein [Puia sp.]